MKYMSQQNILNKYLQYTDSDYIVNSYDIDPNYDICSDCNIEMSVIHSDGVIICNKCGKQESILINSDKPSYKDPPREMYYFAYKRINHFNEFLRINDFIISAYCLLLLNNTNILKIFF